LKNYFFLDKAVVMLSIWQPTGRAYERQTLLFL
jgi:hypothetical protein